jgi:hypothetical protein
MNLLGTRRQRSCRLTASDRPVSCSSPIDVPLAPAALDSFLTEGHDEPEQRETFGYLKQALSETRAAQGERLLFPNESRLVLLHAGPLEGTRGSVMVGELDSELVDHLIESGASQRGQFRQRRQALRL